MKATWALQDAKNRFSEVVQRALSEGPQTITRRGRETAVLLSLEDFKALMAPKGSLVEFFRNSPLRGAGVDLSRDGDLGRDVDL